MSLFHTTEHLIFFHKFYQINSQQTIPFAFNLLRIIIITILLFATINYIHIIRGKKIIFLSSFTERIMASFYYNVKEQIYGIHFPEDVMTVLDLVFQHKKRKCVFFHIFLVLFSFVTAGCLFCLVFRLRLINLHGDVNTSRTS